MARKVKERLDKALLEKGLAASRERARALILEGRVIVNGRPAGKAGTMIDEGAEIVLKGEDLPYVSRGGLKLEKALDHFNIDPVDWVVMDVGASTGGFTDCLLQRGARKVYAVDVGYGQLAWSIRKDERVVVLERTNIRHLGRERIKEAIDLVTIDVSFISLLKVVPAVVGFLAERGTILALIKPQFEVGKGEVDKGGVIKDREKRERTVREVTEGLEALGLKGEGVFESPVRGQKGNIEYFIYLSRDG